MSKPFPDDKPKTEVQRDRAWLEAATPTEITEALARGELADLIASGEMGQKAMAEKAKAAAQGN